MEFLMFLGGYVQLVACFILVTSALGVRWHSSVIAVKTRTFRVELVEEETGIKHVPSKLTDRRQTYIQKIWR